MNYVNRSQHLEIKLKENVVCSVFYNSVSSVQVICHQLKYLCVEFGGPCKEAFVEFNPLNTKLV
jgi:hypothetical protein